MIWITYLWLGLMIGFLLIEVACPVHLVSIWFAVGALVAMIAAALSAPVWLQVLLFVVVSAVLLLAFFPLTKKVFNARLTPTNVDAVIGSTGRVIEQIDNDHARGRVKLGAMEWSARSTTGEVIAPDTHIRVDRIEGVKVFVTPV